MNKRISLLLSAVFLCLFALAFTSAITASIGNSRMILRLEPGVTVEKFVLVKNVNDVSVDIEVEMVGPLKEGSWVEEPMFTLEAFQEKNVKFRVKVPDIAGRFEGKVNVQFAPIENGNGVGLSSTVIILADEKYAGQSPDVVETVVVVAPVTAEVIAESNAVDSGKFLGLSVALIIGALLILQNVVRVQRSKSKKKLNKGNA